MPASGFVWQVPEGFATGVKKFGDDFAKGLALINTFGIMENTYFTMFGRSCELPCCFHVYA